MDSTISGYSPRLRFVNEPDGSGAPPVRTFPRVPARLSEVASRYGCHQRTPERWIDQGLITAYLADRKTILVDLEEIEEAFKSGKIRDPRRPRFSEKATIILISTTGAQ
jgi:excisionase family DNA binding protein